MWYTVHQSRLSLFPPQTRAGAVGFLLYFLVAEASLLSSAVGGGNVHEAAGGAGSSVVWNTYRAVHVTIGLIIMIPILLVAFFPFMTHFQVRLLLYDTRRTCFLIFEGVALM